MDKKEFFDWVLRNRDEINPNQLVSELSLLGLSEEKQKEYFDYLTYTGYNTNPNFLWDELNKEEEESGDSVYEVVSVDNTLFYNEKTGAESELFYLINQDYQAEKSPTIKLLQEGQDALILTLTMRGADMGGPYYIFSSEDETIKIKVTSRGQNYTD